MPRPQGGYKNMAGQPVPATGDINGRFMDRRRLMYWAHNRGKAGIKLYDATALDIGTAVHQMAELHLRDQPVERIEFYCRTSLPDAEDQAKAVSAFGAFCAWRRQFHVDPYALEVSLVSERHQYGGTLDNVSYIRGGLGLLDIKTSTGGEVYEDHLLQLAAYSMLWEETRPNEPLTAGHHLIVLPKDGSKPVHREWSREQLEPARRKFLLYRDAYAIDTSSAKALKGIKVQPSKPSTKPAAKSAVLAEKPRVRVKAVHAPMHTPASLTMGEILRLYGHVKEVTV